MSLQVKTSWKFFPPNRNADRGQTYFLNMAREEKSLANSVLYHKLFKFWYYTVAKPVGIWNILSAYVNTLYYP